ncbi:hypothetical protein AVEN_238298-1 [Araneus ventricosus]|uniref:Uncharacterized protein n=1 Tax=Araneus ventricosus TaxID=182803 RepID=A0A4Y2KDE7_ARAVE|nr:hypothetical protein AVEN_238298-1 [Araneus ventricosus]
MELPSPCRSIRVQLKSRGNDSSDTEVGVIIAITSQALPLTNDARPVIGVEVTHPTPLLCRPSKLISHSSITKKQLFSRVVFKDGL